MYFRRSGESQGDTWHKGGGGGGGGGCVSCGIRVGNTWHMGGPSVMPSNIA